MHLWLFQKGMIKLNKKNNFTNMKKLILSLCLILGFSAAFAQKSNVAKAENYTLQEKPDFAAAR